MTPADDLDDAVAVVLTPPGTGALAVVRVRGAGALRWLDQHLSGRFPPPGRAAHRDLRNEAGEVIDDPVVAASDDGRHVELSLHGGAWVLEATLDFLRRGGVRVAGWRDVPELAHDTPDAFERDVLSAFPLATTDCAARALLAQRSAWKGHFLRHGLRFPDDWHDFWRDVARAPHPARSAGVEEVRTLAGDRSLWRLLHPATVALVGPANVGKSTLANRLLAHERSIVADLPGTTRDWVGERADLDGLPVLLVDTPGLRRTVDSVESAAIARSAEVVRSADLVVLVLDATRPLEGEQRELLNRFASAVRVANKCDLSARLDVAVAGTIALSAMRGDGVGLLIAEIHRRLAPSMFDAGRPMLWLEEQFEAAGRASRGRAAGR